MEPTFVVRAEMKVVGLGTRFISIMSQQNNDGAVIPGLWHTFVNRQNEIPDQPRRGAWGLVEHLPAELSPKPGELFYIAGVEVSSFEKAPLDMLRRVIPAGKYASFTHVGPLTGLRETMTFIYTKWLPSSGVRLRPGAHLELYDQRFDIGSPASEFDILLPVE